ncbi:MAG: hypothetical protein HFG26_09620 [Provencibacterium sp.]|jgi:hypothetical protein|nr:hypothetical protein [Provencibacterium sp.]
MDFSAYSGFPFPSNLPPEDQPLERYFSTLSDEEQLRLLNASKSYPEFRDRVAARCKEQ